MQTFLPYPDFCKSVFILDRQRLGKQRVETYQILKALKSGGGLRGGWANHPASRMWRGHELALLEYQAVTCHEWVTVRGYKDTCWEKSKALFTETELQHYDAGNYKYPEWLADEEFHITHQSNLVRKAPEIYRKFFPEVQDNIAYIWPGITLAEAKFVQ